MIGSPCLMTVLYPWLPPFGEPEKSNTCDYSWCTYSLLLRLPSKFDRSALPKGLTEPNSEIP